MTVQPSLPELVECAIVRKEPFLWLNNAWLPIGNVPASGLHLGDVRDAEARLQRFASLLEKLFPQLQSSGGVIESPLYPAPSLQAVMTGNCAPVGRWFVKGDHALPVAGSIKARGGIYEILVHAEDLAYRSGMALAPENRENLASKDARRLFARHRVIVGSTGNLGLSIGVIAAALAFKVTVHMSCDAKEWKKSRLRSLGVDVVEHMGDFGAAVSAGRKQALQDGSTYFVDDENSKALFLGYSVGAVRLAKQLAAQDVKIDRRHPLFVYLPCGVGGAPGGITFGLRHLFGDDVHCFFAEPVASPCMLIRLASLDDGPISVSDLGLDNRTEADGLAVGQASEFVAPIVRPLVSGVFTVRDEALFEDLFLLNQCEGMRIEPSAAAALRGPRWLLNSEVGRQYLDRHDLLKDMDNATHILWTTGGAFVPHDEYRRFYERGRSVRATKEDRRKVEARDGIGGEKVC